MNVKISNDQNIIERDVHCPFCQCDNAMLISEVAERSAKLQQPNYGLKYWLSVYFTFAGHMLTHGFPIIEMKRTVKYNTYGFCPKCGKSYNAGVPENISNKNETTPKLYRSVKNKVILGICGGISDYTGINARGIRIAMVLHSIAFFPAILYFVFGLANLIKENPKELAEMNNQNNLYNQ